MEKRKTQASTKQVKAIFALQIKALGTKPTREEYNALQNLSREEAHDKIEKLIEVVDKRQSEALKEAQAVVQEEA